MKNKKMVLWIAFIVMAIIPIYAQQYDNEKDFEIDWDPNVKDGILITKYIGTKKEVNIPPIIQNNPVTGIADAFYENKNITRVIIPNSVVRIYGRLIANSYKGAFDNCTSLTSVTIPDSVKMIGQKAFNNCTSLKSITIPNSVTSIRRAAFMSCENLTSITIPNSVTSIEQQAFEGCTSLTSIIIPDSVISLGGGAFYGCNKLTSVTIGNSVKSLDAYEIFGSYRGAFEKCTSLTSVTIGSGVTSIGQKAFNNCESLTSVTFQGNIASKNFDTFQSFLGDLRAKYLASDGGIGTYTRFAGGQTWKKQ